jgi:integrase
VPLTDRAIAILKSMFRLSRDPEAYVFPGGSDGHISNMAMLMCVRGRMGMGYTVHGFRSTFRDWVGDETEFPREIAEAALAHIVGDKAEQAYRRGDALERRRKLMQAWADYLAALNAGEKAKKISLR